MTAPFAALYEGTNPEPKNEYMLPMLMIFPRRRWTIARGAQPRQQEHGVQLRLDNPVPIRCVLEQHATTEVGVAGVVDKDVHPTQLTLDAL